MTEDIDLICVTGVEYVKGYTMRLEFSNGKVKLVNFLPLLKGKLFEPLKDLRNFVQFGLTHWALEWYNGADFAPDYLWRLKTRPAVRFRFRPHEPLHGEERY